MPNSRFDFDDELQQAYSSLQNANDHRTDAQKDNSKVAVYDHSNPEIANMEMEALNLVQDSGAPTLIYLRSDDTGQTDETYNETSNPIYLPPVLVKAMYKPESITLVKVKWGIDADAKFKIHYSRAYLLGLFGSRLIRNGDIISVPHNTLIQTQATEFLEGKINRLDKFRVVHAQDTGNFNFRWLYWTCDVEPLSGDIAIRPST
jgi:hypothetical protein